MITSHNHSSFTVSDLERSVRFYRDIIGFKVDTTIEVKGQAIQQITGQTPPVSQPRNNPGAWILRKLTR